MLDMVCCQIGDRSSSALLQPGPARVTMATSIITYSITLSCIMLIGLTERMRALNIHAGVVKAGVACYDRQTFVDLLVTPTLESRRTCDAIIIVLSSVNTDVIHLIVHLNTTLCGSLPSYLGKTIHISYSIILNIVFLYYYYYIYFTPRCDVRIELRSVRPMPELY